MRAAQSTSCSAPAATNLRSPPAACLAPPSTHPPIHHTALPRTRTNSTSSSTPVRCRSSDRYPGVPSCWPWLSPAATGRQAAGTDGGARASARCSCRRDGGDARRRSRRRGGARLCLSAVLTAPTLFSRESSTTVSYCARGGGEEYEKGMGASTRLAGGGLRRPLPFRARPPRCCTAALRSCLPPSASLHPYLVQDAQRQLRRQLALLYKLIQSVHQAGPKLGLTVESAARHRCLPPRGAGPGPCGQRRSRRAAEVGRAAAPSGRRELRRRRQALRAAPPPRLLYSRSYTTLGSCNEITAPEQPERDDRELSPAKCTWWAPGLLDDVAVVCETLRVAIRGWATRAQPKPGALPLLYAPGVGEKEGIAGRDCV